MPHSLRCSLALGLTIASLAALTTSLRADRAPVAKDLESLFDRYDREPDGPAKDRLAARIDAVAHQKYATVSRLYWYTDLASARMAAREQRRPILHLRMLGKLDEDLSCANSRLFRATLYANQEVSRFLRERFVLYWSSERPVPRVTIDYGDGRRLERTTTGNSAHYILDEEGNVLDVLPGLYASTAFLRELEGSLALAALVRGKSDDERAKLIVDYHKERLTAAKRDSDRLTPLLSNRGVDRPLTRPRVEGALAAAQRATFSKVAIEGRDLRYIAKELAPEALSENEIEMWARAGRVLYGIGDPTMTMTMLPARVPAGGDLTPPPSPHVLDAASRALVIRLHNEVPPELRVTGQRLDALIARLEQTLLADSALNQLRLRPQIASEIVRRGGRTDFATLNAWIYAEVFHSPRQDEWLGLLPRDVFTGLPGDGVVNR
jgi:hypothetical protein